MEYTEVMSGVFMEAVGKSTQSQEIEISRFGVIYNLDELEKLATKKTKIVQHEVRSKHNSNKNAGSIRVRSYDDKKYIMTVKNYGSDKGINSAVENEIEVSKDMFDAMSKLAPISVGKVRYEIPDPTNNELTWELDVPLNMSKVKHAIPCRLELELPSSDVEVPPYPFTIDDKVSRRDFVLLSEMFNTYNPHNILPILHEEK